jgi:hypothetical protein
MKMSTWRQLVRAAEGRVLDFDRRIEHQKDLIQELENDGRETDVEQVLLRTLEDGRLVFEETRIRLLETMPGAQRHPQRKAACAAYLTGETQDRPGQKLSFLS